MHLITVDPVTPEIAARIEALHHAASTTATVTASVAQTSLNVVTTTATSTPDVGFWSNIMHWIIHLFI